MNDRDWITEWIAYKVDTCPGFTYPPRTSTLFWMFILDKQDEFFRWRDAQLNLTNEYAFTLTSNCSPEKVKEVEKEMIEAVNKILSQKTCPTLEAEAYLEYTDAGRPHIHGWYKCEKGHRIYSKIFKRYWPLWNEKGERHGKGFPGGFHELMKTNRYKGYASAEGRRVYSDLSDICNVEQA